MKYISLFEDASKEAIEKFARERHIANFLEPMYGAFAKHPQEDSSAISRTLPIFAVADGVTLDVLKLIEHAKAYPRPSPAGNVARIFCESLISSAEELYSSFDESCLHTTFHEANVAVDHYNTEIGESVYAGNITNRYAATAAYAVLKERKVYWATLCDSFFLHCDKDLNVIFRSSGVCEPYAVVNGDNNMSKYLESGVRDVAPGEKIFIYTDGFGDYMKEPEFLHFFMSLDDSEVHKKIKEYSHTMNKQDPEKYGHERTLIAIEIE